MTHEHPWLQSLHTWYCRHVCHMHAEVLKTIVDSAESGTVIVALRCRGVLTQSSKLWAKVHQSMMQDPWLPFWPIALQAWEALQAQFITSSSQPQQVSLQPLAFSLFHDPLTALLYTRHILQHMDDTNTDRYTIYWNKRQWTCNPPFVRSPQPCSMHLYYKQCTLLPLASLAQLAIMAIQKGPHLCMGFKIKPEPRFGD